MIGKYSNFPCRTGYPAPFEAPRGTNEVHFQNSVKIYAQRKVKFNFINQKQMIPSDGLARKLYETCRKAYWTPLKKIILRIKINKQYINMRQSLLFPFKSATFCRDLTWYKQQPLKKHTSPIIPKAEPTGVTLAPIAMLIIPSTSFRV